MTLVRWQPFRELENILDRYDRLMGRATSGRATTGDWTPTTDITENAREYLIKMELPEVKKDDVKIEVQDRVLSISGERKRHVDEQNEKVHRVESYYGSFYRSFTLPEDVDEDSISAACKEGVLRIHLRKSREEQSKPVQIAIR